MTMVSMTTVTNSIIQHDIKRNLKLTSLGWTIIRLRWAFYQKLNSDKKKEIVESLINGEIPTTPCIKVFLPTN